MDTKRTTDSKASKAKDATVLIATSLVTGGMILVTMAVR